MPQLATFFGLPQRSVPETLPQVAPRRWQKPESVSALQLHWPALQVLGAMHEPQVTER